LSPFCKDAPPGRLYDDPEIIFENQLYGSSVV
jgi:hypothetical protein